MLIDDPSIYNKMLAAASSIEGFSKKLNESTGTLQKLVEDPELYDRLVAATSSIEAFTKKLSEGQGTIGKLVEDPELYERLVAPPHRLRLSPETNEGQERSRGGQDPEP
jgi:phospholipid/cholesterol/gamma-HCH transport system substrate-binding protein